MRTVEGSEVLGCRVMGTLAFDQAFKTTGIAVFNDNNDVVKVGSFTTSTAYPDEVRIKQIKDMAIQYISDYYKEYNDYPQVVIEDIQAQRGNISTYKKLAYAQAAILEAAAEQNVNINIISPSSWRSILNRRWGIEFGRKRADQKKVAKELAEEYIATKHCDISDNITNDIADAICIGLAQILSK